MMFFRVLKGVVFGIAGILSLLFLAGTCAHRNRQTTAPPEQRQSIPIVTVAQDSAAATLVDDGARDRRFRQEVESNAEITVHRFLVAERGRSMPDHWHERGELVKREGDYALVLVHTGVKEGMFADLIVVENYLISIQLVDGGRQYRTTEALRCGKSECTVAQHALLMIKGRWPSAVIDSK